MATAFFIGMGTLATIFVYYARSGYGWSNCLAGFATDGASLTPIHPSEAAHETNQPRPVITGLNKHEVEDMLDWCEANGRPMPRFHFDETSGRVILNDDGATERTAV